MNKGIRQLNGKVAVVTGAASGIGRALALGLADKGCNLALVDVDESSLSDLKAELLRVNPGVTVTTHVADVGSKECMRKLAPAVAEVHGAVHLLFNNAGIGYEAAFPQTSLEAWERVIAVNLWGVIYGCHFFLPYLARVERAHIVNLSSLFGVIGMAGQSAYCTTKFAVRGLSESLWEELRATSIGLTVVHPGSVATNIMDSAEGDDPELLERVSCWFERNAIPPQRAAAQIITAIQQGNARLLITKEARFADFVKRLFPVIGNKLIGDAVIRKLGLGDMREKRHSQWLKTMVEGESCE